MKYEVGKQIFLDGKYWVVTMTTSLYATLESVDNPKVWKMVRK